MKNLNKSLEPGEVDAHHEQVSSVFAMFWNLVKKKHPYLVVEDFENFLTLVNPPRMQYNTAVPSFSLSIGGYTHQIHNQAFAPPSGQTTSNYSRYIHKETNGTRYMVLWFTDRQCSQSVNSVASGGNFFLADYGVRVQAATDTSIVWEPKKAHGTSLMERGDGFLQTGLSIGISKRLASVWEKYRNGVYTEGNMEQEVEKAFEMDDDHEDIVEEGEIVE